MTELTADFGRIVSVEAIMDALVTLMKIVSVVHAETSTGASSRCRSSPRRCGRSIRGPLRGLRHLAGGQTVEAEAWGLDYAYSCSQKALGRPPGSRP